MDCHEFISKIIRPVEIMHTEVSGFLHFFHNYGLLKDVKIKM